MVDKKAKSAQDLKLMIELKLCAFSPDCERAEVIIVPPVGGQPWTARLLGVTPTTGDPCHQRFHGILAELRDEFDLASLK